MNSKFLTLFLLTFSIAFSTNVEDKKSSTPKPGGGSSDWSDGIQTWFWILLAVLIIIGLIAIGFYYWWKLKLQREKLEKEERESVVDENASCSRFCLDLCCDMCCGMLNNEVKNSNSDNEKY